jgi:hypothetical protein
MKRLLLSALVALVCANCASRPVPPAILVPVDITPAVRESIAADWPPPVETMRCLTLRPHTDSTDGVPWLVIAWRWTVNVGATPWKVGGECPEGTVTLHDHLPVTCYAMPSVACVPGGVRAYHCAPSVADRAYLARRPHQPLNGVRCDARALVFYRVR